MKNNAILALSFQFSLDIILYTELLEDQKKYIIARQLFRSGTSIGANIREAQNAESRADFIHKLKLAAKEAEETEYWLLLCKFSNNYPNCDKLEQEISSIIKLLTKIITSAKRNKSAS